MNLWNCPPADLVDALRAAGLRRAYVVTDSESRGLVASTPLLEPLLWQIRNDPDYHAHEACLFEVGGESGHLLTVFLHDTSRGQGAGGVRLWTYATVGELVNDGLRLSRAMGQKCALAGLWWGGGKGIIAREAGPGCDDEAIRSAVFRDYGQMISGLRGCYVTAEDVGTRPEDVAQIFATTRHVTCIPATFGGSGDPSRLTGRGVVVAMEAALQHLGRGDLSGKTVALQGLGSVAETIARELIQRGVERLVGADIRSQRVEQFRRRFGGGRTEWRLVQPDDGSILAEPCDVLSPNALGAVLDPDTIPAIRAPVVCGGANNQLARPGRDGPALRARAVLYVPDFLANRMGIVNCANEMYGALADDPVVLQHLSRDAPDGIYQRCLEVFARSEQRDTDPHAEAQALADELMRHAHPLWPGRARQIVDRLRTDGWAG